MHSSSSNHTASVASRRSMRLPMFIALLLAAVFALPASYARADDASGDATGSEGGGTQIGSLTLLLGDDSGESDSVMTGGAIALYRVATVNRDGNPYYDVAHGQFANSKGVAQTLGEIPAMDKDTLEERNAGIASELEWEAARSGMVPLTYRRITDGEASFPSLEEGLYLVCQPALSKGDLTIHAFLMSLPDVNGDLNAVAHPKPGNGQSPWSTYPPAWYIGGPDDDSDDDDDDHDDDDITDDDDDDDSDDDDDDVDDDDDEDDGDEDDDGDDDDSDDDDGDGDGIHDNNGGRQNQGTSSQASDGTRHTVTIGAGSGDGTGNVSSSKIKSRVPQTGDRTMSVVLIAALGIAIVLIGVIVGRMRGNRSSDAGRRDRRSRPDRRA